MKKVAQRDANTARWL